MHPNKQKSLMDVDQNKINIDSTFQNPELKIDVTKLFVNKHVIAKSFYTLRTSADLETHKKQH